MNRVVLGGLCLVLSSTVVAACSSPSNGGVDTGVPPTDTGVPPTDTGVAPADTGVPGTDSGPAPMDANVLYPDGALMCAAGIECTNYAAELAAAPRDAAGDTPAAALANCVVQLHQSDCCGATDANGINHGARTTLCPAEASCRSQYPTPAGCSDNTITTDTGETTTVMGNVRLRVVNARSCMFGTCYTCETFVCTSDPCRTAPGIAGGCGP